MARFAEAFRSDPTAIGKVPLGVNSPSAPYILEGTNAINYESVLEERWGTYSVFFDMDINISGECLVDTSGEQLDLIVKYSGEQLVEIEAEGSQGKYPWIGTDEIAISLPLKMAQQPGVKAGNLCCMLIRPIIQFVPKLSRFSV